MKTKRLFGLLVVGGGLWASACNADGQPPPTSQTPSSVGSTTPRPDGGTADGGLDPGGGSQFW